MSGKTIFEGLVTGHKGSSAGHGEGTSPLRLVMYGVFIILGILCIVKVDTMYGLLPYIMSAVLIVSGIVNVVTGVKIDEHKTTTTRQTAAGIVYFIIGIVILVLREEPYGLVGAFWGINGLSKAVGELNVAISRIANKQKGWIKLMIFAIFGIVVAILLLINPAEKVHEHMVIIGIELILTGGDALYEHFFEHESEEEEDMSDIGLE